MLAALALAGIAGCHSNPAPTPESTYAQIHSAFLQGKNLDQAAREADAAYRQYSSRDPESASKFRLLEANILTDQGASPRVLTLLQSDLPATLATGELAMERSMFMALAYAHTGHFADADRAYQQARALCPSLACNAAGELTRIGGSIELDKERLDRAQALYGKSLEIARDRNDRVLELSNLINLGLIAVREQRYDESIEWYSQAQALSEQLHAGIGEEKSLGDLAWAYYKMGDFDKSLELSQRAIQKARELGVGIDEIEWLNNVEAINLKQGQFDLAERDYRRSLELARESQNREQEVDALSALAYIRLRSGDTAQASALIEAAIALKGQEGDDSEGLYPLLIRGEIAARRGDLAEAERTFTAIVPRAQNDASLRWEAEQSLAGLYAREREWNRADEEYREALKTVSAARCDIHHEELRMPFLTNATQVYAEYLDFLVGQGKTAEALQTADESRALTLAEGLGMGGSKCLAEEAAFDPRGAARQAKATILFYWLGAEHSYLWAASAERVQLYLLPAASQIEPSIAAYRQALLGPRDAVESNNSCGTQLYRMLVAPAAEFLHPNQRVIVVADGDLSGLNFETLIVPGSHPHYWIEDATVENASSLRLLAAAPRRPAASGGKLLLMGDPVPPGGSQFRVLRGAAKEMQSVRGYFAAADEQVFEQKDSTPAAYIDSHPEQFAYIHFVAHGTASLADPLDSAVVLSPVMYSPSMHSPATHSPAGLPGVEGSYKLYAREIVAHPLHAGLVTISSCKGAGARSYSGEGLVGLSWAFLHAGAHQVIGALWDVSDEATPRLMDAMYGELVKGQPPETALRTAKLSLMHSGLPFSKPYYWAAFQLYTGS